MLLVRWRAICNNAVDASPGSIDHFFFFFEDSVMFWSQCHLCSYNSCIRGLVEISAEPP